MAIINLSRGQNVSIPAIQLTDGHEFHGIVKACEGEKLIIETSADLLGMLPKRVDDTCVLVWVINGNQKACPIQIAKHQDRTIMCRAIIQERREAPRVRADVDLSYELVPAARVHAVAEEVMARVNSLAEPRSETYQLLRTSDDPVGGLYDEISNLRQMIFDLIKRIDHLTDLVSGEVKPVQPEHRLTPICIQNCSSTGIGIVVRELHPEGEYLRMNLTLRTTPQTIIDCMGVVVRCVDLSTIETADNLPNEGFDLGIRFTHIHESDREHLIHYLFKVQRRLLRDLKQARETATT